MKLNLLIVASLRDMPPAGSFFLDKKGTKKSRPIEICLISLRNSGKTKTRPAVAWLRQFVFLIGISSSAPAPKIGKNPISGTGRQISKWPI